MDVVHNSAIRQTNRNNRSHRGVFALVTAHRNGMKAGIGVRAGRAVVPARGAGGCCASAGAFF
jgi:hypothetical protein